MKHNGASSNRPQQSRTIRGMDPVLYEAAADGRMEAFEHIVYPLDCLRTIGNNTILHIYATTIIKESESTVAFVNAILNKCQSLLWETNNKGETPLHIAARYGHVSIVNCLIEHAKIDLPQDLESGIQEARKLLRITNKKKDTALHEAVRQNHLAVVILLLTEDPDFSYSANDAGETPLYLAIERNFRAVALKILESCGSPSFGGPLGRTALHAAVIQRDTVMIEELLNRFGDISIKADQNGWTPIHFAAFFDYPISAGLLLEADRQAAYMKDLEGMTALQIAAHRGNDSVMETIISRCPDCCELVDNRGWNVLHFAIDGRGGKDTVGVILKYSSLSNLLNEEDFDGNTPFHHQSNSNDIEDDLMDHPRVDKMAFNKLNLAGRDITLLGAKFAEKKLHYIEHVIGDLGRARRVVKDEDHEIEEAMDALQRVNDAMLEETEKAKKMEEEAVEKENKEYTEKAAGAHLVVAALITTVTFTAGITIPGGFQSGDDSHPGSAILRGSAAFRAFVVSNELSMLSSTCAVFIHLFVPGLREIEHRENFLLAAWLMILLAMGAMVLAFVTGSYAVLAPSLPLAIFSCIIGLFFFPILFLIFRKALKD